MLNVIMLNVIRPSVVILNVIRLNVVMLSVVAPLPGIKKLIVIFLTLPGAGNLKIYTLVILT